MKIRAKILFVLLSIVFITGISVAIVSKIVSQNIVTEQIRNSLEGVAHSKANHVRALLVEERNLALQLSESVVIEKLLISNKADADYEGRLNDVITQLKNSANLNKDIYDIFVLDTNGVVIASSIEQRIGLNRNDDPYFINIINNLESLLSIKVTWYSIALFQTHIQKTKRAIKINYF